MKTEAEIPVTQPQAKNAWRLQRLEESRKDPSLELLEGT